MKLGSVRSQKQIKIESLKRLQVLCGPENVHLKILEKRLKDYALRAESQGGGIQLEGSMPGLEIAEEALSALSRRVDDGVKNPGSELGQIVRSLKDGTGCPLPAARLRCPLTQVSARTSGQHSYVEDLLNRDNSLIFSIGPAGTGKTHLAVAAGVQALSSGECQRLVLARPALEAGESLGFLPGDIENKTDPYMLPVMDSLNALIGSEELAGRKSRGEIECAPLAYMRGRTFNQAFIVVDEAQNATLAQMRMVLTRLGHDSRMVVSGDPSQTDLPDSACSGLDHAVAVLAEIEGVCISRLGIGDVVRHRLVSEIIRVWRPDVAKS